MWLNHQSVKLSPFGFLGSIPSIPTKNKNKMIEIVNSRVFIEGKETVDPVLIGYAVLDFAESQENDGMKIILKDQDVFIESLITHV